MRHDSTRGKEEVEIGADFDATPVIATFAVLALAFGAYFVAPQAAKTRAATAITGDINGDGKVDIFDLSILLSNFGKSTTSSPSPTTTATSSATPTNSPAQTPNPPGGPLIMNTHYDVTQLVPDAGWQVYQKPRNPYPSGPLLDRITMYTGSSIPGNGTRPKTAIRVELKPGDVQTIQTNGNVRHASELYALHSSNSNATADKWVMAPGKEVWFHVPFMLDASYQPFTDSSDWIAFMQFKGQWGGSPPTGLEAHLDRLTIDGTSGRHDLGALPIGTWTDLIIGMKMSPDKNIGWIQVERDGKMVLPRTSRATMGYDINKNGTNSSPVADPVYLKQGMYRTGSHESDAIDWFGPMKVAYNRGDVL